MKKKTTEETINDFIKIHGDRYDYSLVEYIGSQKRVEIICKEHGIFKQKPNNHLNGQNCFDCEGSKKKTNQDIINEFNKIYNNKFDYSLVDYKSNKKHIKIICKEHGMFEQAPTQHLRGKGCSECNSTKFKFEFFKRSNILFDNFYDYSLVNYKNNRTKVTIICPIHREFDKRPDAHLKGEGCQKCTQSKGENEIRNILEFKNIKYISQKMFDDCKNIKKLPFDFYLPNHNTCIEFDGEQHYKINEFFGGEKSFKELQLRDKIKDEYCLNNNIHLLRIKYNENIEEKLNEFLISHNKE